MERKWKLRFWDLRVKAWGLAVLTMMEKEGKGGWGFRGSGFRVRV